MEIKYSVVWYSIIILQEEGDEKKSPEKKEKKPKTKSVDLPIIPEVSEYSKEAINLLQEREVSKQKYVRFWSKL